MLPLAKQISAETGIPWQVLLAIPANETGWGQSVFHNNYYGIKDPNGQAARTWEVVNGQRQDITDRFAAFDSPEASMRAFNQFLRTNSRYAEALDYLKSKPNDWPTFVGMLNTAGYATDPLWSQKVISIGQSLESPASQSPSTLSPRQSTGSLFDVARSAVGSKYVWGGTGGRNNFDSNFVGSDCSGFVAWAYHNALGIALPAFTGSIYAASKPIDPQDAVPGDLIMFNMNSSDPRQQHVAIYEGNGMMIHDSSINPNGGVEETSIWSGGEFRRVQGVNAADLSRAATPAQDTTPTSDVRQTPVPQNDATRKAIAEAIRARTDYTHPDQVLTQPTQVMTKPTSGVGGGNEMGAGQSATPPQDLQNPEDQWIMYHGTGADFPAVDPERLQSPYNLFGPGLYLSDDPEATGGRTADSPYAAPTDPLELLHGGYAFKGVNSNRFNQLQYETLQDQRALDYYKTEPRSTFVARNADQDELIRNAQANVDWGQQQLGEVMRGNQPNVRKIGVPKSLRFLDFEQPVDADTAQRLAQIFPDLGMSAEDIQGGKGDRFYEALLNALGKQGHDFGDAKYIANRELANAGWDGLAHSIDARQVRIVFPESVGKIQNLTSKQWGGADLIDPSLQPGATDKGADWTPIQPDQHVINQGEVTPPGPDIFTEPDIPLGQEPVNKGEVPKPKPNIFVPTGGPGIAVMGGGQESERTPSMSKKEASYTKKATEDHCQDCSMFQANTCSLVKGFIHNTGSCDYFEPKQMGAGQDDNIEDIPVIGGIAQGFRHLGETASQALDVGMPQREQPKPRTPQEEAEAAKMATTISGMSTGLPDIQGMPKTLDEAQAREQQRVQQGLEGATTAASVAVPGVAAGLVGPELAGGIGGTAAIGAASTAVQQAPDIAQAAASGDPRQMLAQGAMVVGGGLMTGMLPVAGKVAGKVAGPAMEALSSVTRPLGERIATSPMGKFLTDEIGAATAQGAITHAIGTAEAAAVGGVLGAAGHVVPALATSTPQQQADPNWRAQQISDAVDGAKLGGALAAGIAVTYPLTHMLWDKTVDPTVVANWNRLMEPLQTIDDLGAREALATWTDRIKGAYMGAEVTYHETQKELGDVPVGQGLNQADMLGHAEQFGTLLDTVNPKTGARVPGYVSPDGVAATQAHEDWLQARLQFERDHGDLMRVMGVLSPTQDVRTPVGEPGPSEHIYHLYESTVQAAKRKMGLGWREGVTMPRDKTIDPTAPPDTPRTLWEALSLHRANPANPKPSDNVAEVFSTSVFQTYRAEANFELWQKIKNSPVVEMRRAGTPIPDGWVARPNRNWGLGNEAEMYAFDPQVARYFDNVTSVRQTWLQDPTMEALRYISSPLKQLAFSASPVHLFNIGHRAWEATAKLGAGPMVSIARDWILPLLRPNGRRNVLLANKDVFLRGSRAGVTGSTMGHLAADMPGPNTQHSAQVVAARMAAAGLTSGAAGWLQAHQAGASDEDAWKEAGIATLMGTALYTPGTGTVANMLRLAGRDVNVLTARSFADVIHSAIFSNVLPVAKIGLWDVMTKNGADEKLAAEFVNNTLGGIDVLKMGRSPVIQSILRFATVAADWEEGQVRSIFNLFSPTPAGALTRRWLAYSMATYMGHIEALNYAINGHFTWQNGAGHEYELETTGIQDGLADMRHDPGLRAVDTNGRPTRSYADPMPPMRWALETIGEATRSLAYTFANLEQGHLPMGQSFPAPAPQAGQRLQRLAAGDPNRGELPPDLAGKLGEDVTQRIGFPFAAGAHAIQAASGHPTDWTLKPLIPLGPDYHSPWSSAMIRASAVLAPQAPSGLVSVIRDIDPLHPGRGKGLGMTLLDALGITRTSVVRSGSENLTKADNMLRRAGIDPAQQAKDAQDYQNQKDVLDNKGKALFDNALTSGQTHQQIDDGQRGISQARKLLLTTRAHLGTAVTPYLPEEWKGGAENFLANVWNGNAQSPRSADLNPHTDFASVSDAYFNPPNISPKDEQGLKQARANLLKDIAEQNDENPDAVHDALKWAAQHKDPNGLVKAPPTLGGMSSDDLANAVTQFLDAANDDKGNPITDSGDRADSQRNTLNQLATRYKVDPNNLLQRINLRLSRDDVPAGLEKSYNDALQVLFDSRNPDKYPKYVNADGTPMGTYLDWKKFDGYLAQQGAMKRYDETAIGLSEALKRGTDARLKFISNSAARDQYQQWFGTFGRSMSEKTWQQYIAGNVIGYKDLDAQSPKNETLRRDRMIEMYNSSSLDERANTTVYVWSPSEGDYFETNLFGAYKYLHSRTVFESTAGREYDQTYASDDLSYPGVQ
jgi:hypothetical protein